MQSKGTGCANEIECVLSQLAWLDATAYASHVPQAYTFAHGAQAARLDAKPVTPGMDSAMMRPRYSSLPGTAFCGSTYVSTCVTSSGPVWLFADPPCRQVFSGIRLGCGEAPPSSSKSTRLIITCVPTDGSATSDSMRLNSKTTFSFAAELPDRMRVDRGSKTAAANGW